MTENNVVWKEANNAAGPVNLTTTRAPVALSKASTSGTNKAEGVIKRLRGTRGATVADMMKITGWQAHSVRGFLSGTLRKKLSLNLQSEVGKNGQRRYRIVPKSGG